MHSIPNELRSQNCRTIVDFQWVFERVELELDSANGLGDFVPESPEWRQQTMEEVVHHVGN